MGKQGNWQEVDILLQRCRILPGSQQNMRLNKLCSIRQATFLKSVLLMIDTSIDHIKAASQGKTLHSPEYIYLVVPSQRSPENQLWCSISKSPSIEERESVPSEGTRCCYEPMLLHGHCSGLAIALLLSWPVHWSSAAGHCTALSPLYNGPQPDTSPSHNQGFKLKSFQPLLKSPITIS